MEIINVGNNPNRLVKVARTHPWTYMFNDVTGKIAVADDQVIENFETDWYYITSTDYPVFEGCKYVGSHWDSEYGFEEHGEVD